MTEQHPAADRSAEIAAGLEHVHGRIEAACAAAGRTDRPRLIVVTKTHPAEDVLSLARLGVTDVGENRDQEARPKAEATAGLCAEASVTAPAWHFIGQLQSNKAKHVIRYAAAVHSVDRESLVDALARAMQVRAERAASGEVPAREDLDCLIQVDVDPREPEDRPTDGIGGRGGAAPEDVPALAARIAAAPRLRLRGLMCVAPRGIDPAESFARAADLSARLRDGHPEADRLSMGMTADLEEAVAAGATHLRIGSDILGRRAHLG
ncbi:Hypothetical protein YggS, proline synthase co-transcribed bacterial homolog PROSC [Micrococcus lylae]|uniref:Pyridoxal phosphate homeostasis protein n=1 Tax=Micrococcus lylae TaxID=1273 RepID=A0A1R4J6I2_9MICC|nr:MULTISPECIES: YggS family pyridoxal phosphate-dependent enzyme [Micrococcus]MCT2007817.1 YggS family pyridoxal phosphate-dependent enzyme [Micrococcus lylae]MCT2072017.1 YggS family pyridoxal phosphate-dependent enzyme [Micrococcus lylae]OFR90165.1 YggS family pyridoxal phosphate enzyme [Micrococcus sp. HMSC067E09]TFI00189.1 YggS family pyridoxal phosphate-dependent enzyme [Micrococcus lylae]SJN27678.1 Hypothetical protein YggS, proline synthase co-transcribed bacterial homolog PROSC [Micro